MSFRLKLAVGIFLVMVAVAAGVLLVVRRPSWSLPILDTPSAPVPTSTLPSPSAGTSTSSPAPAAPASTSSQGSALQADLTAGTSDLSGSPLLPETFRAAGSIVELSATASPEQARSVLLPSAEMIAERFGTFSSQNNFTNLRDLRPFMTASLQAWLDDTIAKEELKRASAPQTYRATNTIALRSRLTASNFDAGTATTVVETSRTESGSGALKTYTQSFEVKFTRDAGGWKIDNVRWVR